MSQPDLNFCGKTIGTIGNYYGSLEVAIVDDKYFWTIEDCTGKKWESIPPYLAAALFRFEFERNNMAATPPATPQPDE